MRIEEALKPPFLDAGGVSNRRRRAPLSLSCSWPRLSLVSLVFFIASFTTATSGVKSFRRRLAVESQSGWRFLYGPGFTRSESFWGAPHSSSSTAFLTICTRRTPSSPLLTIVEAQIYDFPPLVGVSTVCSNGSGFLKSDPPPYSPLETSGPSPQLRFSHRESLSVRQPPPLCFSLYSPNWRMVPDPFPSPDSTRPSAGRRAHSTVYLLPRRGSASLVSPAVLGQNNLLVGLISPPVFNFNMFSQVSQPTNQWGILVFLAIFLKIFGGFIKIFTETELFLQDFISLSKNRSSAHLSVDSSGSSPSSYTSFLRSAFPPIFEWRCVSISIAVLLSCVAVRSGPEDTTDFVSTIFRGADWMSTSRYTVTISQVFGNVVNFVSTHPSSALDPLSFYLRAFAIFYVVLTVVWRVRSNFPFNCSSDV